MPRKMLRNLSLPNAHHGGEIYLCAMPGRFESLDIFLQGIAKAGIGHVLCLVSDGEIARKSPDYHMALQRNGIPITEWRFEIPDYGMPEDPDELRKLLEKIRERLDAGESIVIHCAAGHGRTVLVATLLLMEMGLPLDLARDRVAEAGSAPDTSDQRTYLEQWK